MSEGHTTTATFTAERQLDQKDIDVLNQIILRAHNDPIAEDRPKDALLQAYGEIFDERKLNSHQDRACFNVILKLLDPGTPGPSLYHKWETLLRQKGIKLTYEDDATTQDDLQDNASRRSLDFSEPTRPASASPHLSRHDDYYPNMLAVGEETMQAAENDAFIDNPPAYIPQLMHRAEMRDFSVLAGQTLEAWRNAAEVSREQRRRNARADALHEVRLKRKVLKQCLAVFQDLRNSQQQADAIYYRRLAKNALSKTTDEYRVRRIGFIDEDRVKGLSLYKWTLASREAAIARRREWQTKRNTMQKLVEAYRARQAQQAQLENLLQQRQAQQAGSLLRSAMLFLAEKNSAAQANQAQAERRDHNALCLAKINVWRAKLGRLTELALTAEDAREYFLMKRVLRQLRDVTRFRRDRRFWLATWASRRWHAFVKTQKHARYDEAYRQMRRTIKISLARRLLYRWQQKAHVQREQQAQADAMYQNALLQRIARPIVEKAWETADRVQRNDLIADKQADQYLQHRALTAFQVKQQSIEGMSDRADRLRQYRTEQKAVQGLRQMQLKAFELQRRQLDADAFRDRHEKRDVRNMLAKIRRYVAERRTNGEGALALVPAPAQTPAKKREELLMFNSTRMSTTPAYTPFTNRLRAEPRVLEDIEDGDEGSENVEDSLIDANGNL